ncbi:JNK-interacting protein 1 [Trichinella zimbabwensis]|uniref:JNK-interacting protein 1 n=2 Tax=Trichinella TaxID=6333 RepID=A0A0V1MKY0_9BILA|nr:JNK-interacting protein 1 [Trichinella zimbabwensis]KRZ72210.1 JNK-interacting protein 1 [Trichinella papuae]
MCSTQSELLKENTMNSFDEDESASSTISRSLLFQRPKMRLDFVSSSEKSKQGLAYLQTPMSPKETWMENALPSEHQLYFDGGTPQVEFSEPTSYNGQFLYDASEKDTSKLISSFSDDKSSGIFSTLPNECTQPSHRTIHKFIPRHDDELLLEVGDPVFIQHEYEDHWCKGVNLRTFQVGIFPSVHVFEMDLDEQLSTAQNYNHSSMGLMMKHTERASFFLTFLGSIEVAHHKGNDVVVQAINKILQIYKNREETIMPRTVLLDVSFKGVHVIDKSSKNLFRCARFDYFYSLQNISFCGAHPKQLRYFGFITKHPSLPVFACHVFMSKCSTQSVVDAIGRAFQRSYNEYMAFSHPTEDIYLE